MAIRVEPHRIKVRFKNGTVIVCGEAYSPPNDGYDYTVDTASMMWDSPNENSPIQDSERTEIVEIIKKELGDKKWSVEYL